MQYNRAFSASPFTAIRWSPFKIMFFGFFVFHSAKRPAAATPS